MIDLRCLQKLIRKFNRKFERECATLSLAALRAGYGVKSHLTSLDGSGMRSAALRASAIKAIDEFKRQI